MSDVVMVLGMHRSGTSAVAGVLAKLGGRLPNTTMVGDEKNAKGYFESNALMAFHEELLASAGSSWQDWRKLSPGWYASPTAAVFKVRAKDLFIAEFGDQPLAVLKDPRICRFAPFWLDVLKGMGVSARVVMPIRSPLEVAQSLKRWYGLSLRKGLLLWLRHCLDAEQDTRGVERALFTWSDFHADWRRVAEHIGRETGLSWPALSDRSVAEIEAFLDPGEMHFSVSQTQLARQSDVQEWMLTAYRSLVSLAAEPEHRASLEALDEVRREFDAACKALGPVLAEQELSLERHAELIESLRGEHAGAAATLNELDARRAASEQQAERLQAALTQVEAGRDASVAELTLARDVAQASLAPLEQMLAEAREEVQRWSTDHASLAAVAEDRSAHVEQLSDELGRARDDAGRQARDLADARHLIDELKGDVRHAQSEAARNHESLADAQRRVQQLAEEVEGVRAGAARGSEDLAEARRRIQDLAEALELAGTTAVRQGEALAAAQGEAGRLDHELAQVQGEALRAAVVAQADVRRLDRTLAEALEGRSTVERDLLSARVVVDAAVARLEYGSRRGFARRLLVGHNALLFKMWRLSRAGLFDGGWYRRRNAHLMAPGELAIGHYLRVGFAIGCEPNPVFDSLWYLKRYEDVIQSGLNPVLHYALTGWREGRDPAPGFSTRFYLERNPDVAASGDNPLAHYLRHGRREGRLPRPLTALPS